MLHVRRDLFTMCVSIAVFSHFDFIDILTFPPQPSIKFPLCFFSESRKVKMEITTGGWKSILWKWFPTFLPVTPLKWRDFYLQTLITDHWHVYQLCAVQPKSSCEPNPYSHTNYSHSQCNASRKGRRFSKLQIKTDCGWWWKSSRNTSESQR